MAQALKDIKLTFDALYTSDLKRAADTANAVVELFGVDAQVDSELRERHFGALQGLSIGEAPLKHPDIWQAHIARNLEHDLGGGESIQQFALRVQNALDKIQARHTADRRCHSVEQRDKYQRPTCRVASVSHFGYGEEANNHVGQASGTNH